MSEEAKGGGNKGMMMIIMAMLGLIIVALVGVSIFLIMNLGSDDDVDASQGIFLPVEPPTWHDLVPLHIGQDITTNLLPRANGNRHAVMLSNLALSINNLDEEEAEELMDGISQREAAVVSTINDILRRTTPEELEVTGGVEILRENILDALRREFTSNLIVEVHFQIIVH